MEGWSVVGSLYAEAGQVSGALFPQIEASAINCSIRWIRREDWPWLGGKNKKILPHFMQQYFLSSHVRLCALGERGVLMDLLSDEYFSFNPAEMSIVSWHLREGSAPRAVDCIPATMASADQSSAAPIIKKLLSKKMLVVSKPPAPASPVVKRPESLLVQETLHSHVQATAGQTLRFLYSWLKSVLMLKFFSIAFIVERIERRKVRAMGEANYLIAAEIEEARPLVERYLHLRPWFFSARNRCLRDSLALIEFLACYRIYPVWVIGVSHPFKAHSWVQEGVIIFNDSLERVRRFTPILTV